MDETIFDDNLLTWNDDEYYYNDQRTCVQFSTKLNANCDPNLVCEGATSASLSAQRTLLLEALENDFGLHPFCPETNLPICGEKLYLEID